MKKYIEVLIAASLTCLVTGVLAQNIEMESFQALPPPPQLQGAPADGDAVLFYESLQPYGSWVQVSPFGPVWRPHVAVKDTSWRPYCNGGKWVWHKNSWCWESEYEWGWAPFHYGRWIRSSRLGWVWIPGREWSGAWVNWRQTSTHYGWAPLPPERSTYVSVSTATDSGVTWGFQFGLTQDHYISAPCQSFPEVVYVRNYDHNSRSDYRRYDDHDRRPQYEYRKDRPVAEERRQPAPARTSEPSRRTTIMQQVISRTTTSATSTSRPVQHVVSQPRTVAPTPQVSSSRNTAATSSASSDRRSSRIMDIMARSRK